MNEVEIYPVPEFEAKMKVPSLAEEIERSRRLAEMRTEAWRARNWISEQRWRLWMG